ncbi:hypothetical protein QTP88_003633 [Uroleucon formosanum]
MIIYAGRAARDRFQLPLCPFPHFTSRQRVYPSERSAAAGPSPRCKNRRRRHYIRTRVTYCFKMHRTSTAAVAAAAHVKPKTDIAQSKFCLRQVRLIFFTMSALLNVICAVEASGELDEPTSLTTTRQFWVHPLNQKRKKEDLFENFYCSIRKFLQKFF